MDNVNLELLAEHPEVLPELQDAFESEWPEYYGALGKASAKEDLLGYSNRSQLPIGVIAMENGAAVGIAVLKAKCLITHSHLSPWIGGGMVLPQHRRCGTGTRLAIGLENIARNLGYKTIYSGTSTANSLLKRNNWLHIETIRHDGKSVSIYEKSL